MGDFDRQESGGAKANDTKKAVIALVLGVVLIGLLANWYLKRTMQPAAAGVGAPRAGGRGVPVAIGDDDMSPAWLAWVQAWLESELTGAELRSRSEAVSSEVG